MKKRTPKSIRRAILEIVKETPGVPVPRKLISRTLEIHKRDYHLFEKVFQDLVKSGELIHVRKNQYAYPQRAEKLVGELRTTRSGFGFVAVPGQEADIFVARNNLNTAFDRDTVEVQLYAASRGRRLEGFIKKIHKRFRQEIVGIFHKTDYYSYVTPDGNKIYRDIVISNDETGKAMDGKKVLVRFEKWDHDQHNPEGTIIEVLGAPDDPGVDIISVVHSYNLPVKFSKDVEKIAKTIEIVINKETMKNRLDLRELTCFTIDPVDAKDFDDAISLEVKKNGNQVLGVHIADVSHYVPENSKIDKEAFERSTSVYLVDRVIPMLPEHLSNELCSLKPDTDRLTFTCFMELDKNLDVVTYTLQPSVIHSKRRFAYEEVQEIADGKLKDPLKPVIDAMVMLGRNLTKKRFAQGGIDFETPEVRFVLDEKGKPVEVIPRNRLDSHRLVEEFMLLANQTVAQHIKKISPEGHQPLPFLYRVHEKPDQDKMLRFFDLLTAINIPFKPAKIITSKFIQQLFEEIKGSKEQMIIEEIALRSMMKAIYSTTNIGHFGLGFKDYTHFTSPIRRYPDLIVHRLLKEYAQPGRKIPGDLPKKLNLIGEQATRMERLAMEAERESIRLKQVEYIEKFQGEIFKGLVSGVTSFGVFVELEENFVEGIIVMSNMNDDFYIYDEKTYSLLGRDTGQIIRLGDEVRVRVDSVDVGRKEVEFSLVESLAEHDSSNVIPPPPSDRRKSHRRRKKGSR